MSEQKPIAGGNVSQILLNRSNPAPPRRTRSERIIKKPPLTVAYNKAENKRFSAPSEGWVFNFKTCSIFHFRYSNAEVYGTFDLETKTKSKSR